MDSNERSGIMSAQRRWWQGLQFRINLLFISVLLGILVVLTAVLAVFARDVLLERDRQLVNQTGEFIVAELEHELEHAVGLARSIAGISGKGGYSAKQLNQHLNRLLSGSPFPELIAGGGIWPEPYKLDTSKERASLFWGRNQQGDLIFFDDYNNPNEPSYQRAEWYQPARYYQGNHCYWSRSYADPYTRTAMVTCSVAIYYEAVFWGVATVDVRMNGLQQRLNQRVAELGGYALLLDRNHRLIAAPNRLRELLMPDKSGLNLTEMAEALPQLVELKKLSEHINEQRKQVFGASNRRLMNRLLATTDGIDKAEASRIISYLSDVNPSVKQVSRLMLAENPVTDESVQTAVVLIGQMDWSLVLLVPDRVAIAGTKALVWKVALLLVAAVVAGMLIIAYRFQMTIVSPLKQMTAQLRQSGDGSSFLNERHTFELGELAHAYNRQQEQLQYSRKGIEQSHKRLSAMMTSAIDGILTLSRQGVIMEANPSAERLLQADTWELKEKRLVELIDERCRAHFELKLQALLIGEDYQVSTDELCLSVSGKEVAIELSMSGWQLDDEGFVTVFLRDITERKAAEARVQYMATRDSLTGLLNRFQFNEQLQFGIDACQRSEHNLALLLIDLDHFKAINDEHGHQAGDQLLIEVAQRLRESRRTADQVARLGGDEFAVILQGLETIDAVPSIAQSIVDELEQPFLINDSVCHIGASIGVTFFPHNADKAEELVRQADMAMYQAKADGRSTWRCFAQDLFDNQQLEYKRRAELEQAISDKQLYLIYQPVVQVDTEQPLQLEFEALMRWRHPQAGVLLPSQFLPQAERSELMIELGNWLLETICRQLHVWQQQGLTIHVVSVNLAALQLEHGQLHSYLARWLETYQLTPDRVRLEVTETILLDPKCSAVLDQLAVMGVPLTLDSFGSGYASLSMLQRFPINQIKLASSLVQEVEWNQARRSLCKAIVAMAHNLGITVVAKGVETEGQVELLRRMGCDALQGYHLYRPMRTTSEIRSMAKHSSEAIQGDGGENIASDKGLTKPD